MCIWSFGGEYLVVVVVIGVIQGFEKYYGRCLRTFKIRQSDG